MPCCVISHTRSLSCEALKTPLDEMPCATLFNYFSLVARQFQQCAVLKIKSTELYDKQVYVCDT